MVLLVRIRYFLMKAMLYMKITSFFFSFLPPTLLVIIYTYLLLTGGVGVSVQRTDKDKPHKRWACVCSGWIIG